MMKPERPVGIVGYGAYIPRFRIAAREIARIWDAPEERRSTRRAYPVPTKIRSPCLSRRHATRWRERILHLTVSRQCGSAARAIPTRSNHPAHWSPRRSARRRGSAPQTGSSPAKLALRR